MEWVTAHWSDLLEIALAALGVASMIARVTPTEADNKIVDKVYSFVHLLGFTKPK